MIFITGRNKRAIEDHFDTAFELEAELEAAGKTQLLELVRNVIPKNITCVYIRQSAPLGLGHAVLCARPVVGDAPFAVLLADDFMDVEANQTPVLAQMTKMYAYEGCSILAVNDVPRADTKQYGIVSAIPYRPNLELVDGIVEKPAPEAAPSTLAVVGRYILNSHIFDHLAGLGQGAGGEIQLTDGIAQLMKEERVLGYRFAGTRYDCGSKMGYLKATIAMGLKHPETGKAFADYVQQLLKTDEIK
jgi:UTP--glucose-1-phosphate uridylyltransferase